MELGYDAIKSCFDNIEDRTKETNKTGEPQCLSMKWIDNQGKDVVFMFLLKKTNRFDIRKELRNRCIMKKYETKSFKCIGLGNDINDNEYLINDILYMEAKWIYDELLEKYKNKLSTTCRILIHFYLLFF